MAILFGLAVFAVIVAVGWRSVQNRRILRLRDTNGQETIIVAREGDDISSVIATTEITEPASVPNVVNVEDNAAGRSRLKRVVPSTK